MHTQLHVNLEPCTTHTEIVTDLTAIQNMEAAGWIVHQIAALKPAEWLVVFKRQPSGNTHH